MRGSRSPHGPGRPGRLPAPAADPRHRLRSARSPVPEIASPAHRPRYAPPVSEPGRSSGRVDRWLSIAVGVGALCAVAVSLYQAALVREQQRASAWPYLNQSNSYVPGQPYTRQVVNQGVGPARVRSFEVLVDGRPVPSWDEAVQALTGRAERSLIYTSFGRGNGGTGARGLRAPRAEVLRAAAQGDLYARRLR